MKILHVCPTLNPEAGGTVTMVRALTEFSPTNQAVLCLDPPDSPWLGAGKSPYTGLGHLGGKYSYCPALVPHLQRVLPQYDIVVVHGTWQYHSIGTRRALQSELKPYVIFPHGMLDPWFRRTYPLKHLKKLPYWYLCERAVLRDAARVVFTSTEEQAGAHASFTMPSCHEVIVPLGISDPMRFAPKNPDRLNLRILFLSRLDLKKGCDQLLEGFARVMRGTGWKLIMAGPDFSGWQQTLQAQASRLGIADQVEWPGMLHGEAKWQAFNEAQALILPSHQENFGLVVVEALACGTPVLLSEQVNIWREVVKSGGGWAAPDNVDGVESLLQRWLNLEAFQKMEMGQAARKCFKNFFDLPRSFEQLMTVLEDSLSSPSC